MVHGLRFFLITVHGLRFTALHIYGSRLFTYFAQVSEAVDACVMAVAPAGGERVAPDDLNVGDGQVVGHGLGPQHALARELVDALRARAKPPQPRRPVAARPTVRPAAAQPPVRLLHDLARLD